VHTFIAKCVCNPVRNQSARSSPTIKSITQSGPQVLKLPVCSTLLYNACSIENRVNQLCATRHLKLSGKLAADLDTQQPLCDQDVR
jgi:hypothetical protein